MDTFYVELVAWFVVLPVLFVYVASLFFTHYIIMGLIPYSFIILYLIFSAE